MTNLSYRQAMLIKHTAWMNTRLLARGPRPEDERYVPLAVRMLTLVGCLNYAMLDLESELTASGLFHHETKRRLRRLRLWSRRLTASRGRCFARSTTEPPGSTTTRRTRRIGPSAAVSCWRLLKGLTTSCCRCVGSSALSTVGFRAATTSTRPNLLYASRLCWSVSGSRIVK